MNQQITSLADYSRIYFKTILHDDFTRRYFNMYKDSDICNGELKELNLRLAVFSINHEEFYDILYDTFILSSSVKEQMKKYKYSKRSVLRRRRVALELFYNYLPAEFR